MKKASYVCWSEVSLETQALWWKGFKKSCRRGETQVPAEVVRKTFKHKGSGLVRNIIREARDKSVEPIWMKEDLWEQCLEKGKEDVEYFHHYQVNKRNRDFVEHKDVPVYSGGSVSTMDNKRQSGENDHLVEQAAHKAPTSEGSHSGYTNRSWVEGAGGVKKRTPYDARQSNCTCKDSARKEMKELKEAVEAMFARLNKQVGDMQEKVGDTLEKVGGFSEKTMNTIDSVRARSEKAMNSIESVRAEVRLNHQLRMAQLAQVRRAIGGQVHEQDSGPSSTQ